MDFVPVVCDLPVVTAILELVAEAGPVLSEAVDGLVRRTTFDVEVEVLSKRNRLPDKDFVVVRSFVL